MKALNIISILFIISCIFLAGCGAIKEKFTRKPKETPKKEEIFLQEGEKYPVETRYSNYYTYWDIWLDELAESIGKNNKKTLASADRALYNLQQMKKLLKPYKQQELEVEVQRLESIVEELHDRRISTPRQKRVITMLRDHMYTVRREFDLEAVEEGGWLIEE